MSTFIEITPDAFNNNFALTANDTSFRGEARNGQRHVRRPVRGIQIKDDTYATIQVKTARGDNLALFDAAGFDRNGVGRTNRNSNFLIQQVQEQRAEKQQIILTFGSPYIYFFGEQPRILQVSGVLLNTEDFNWRAEWWENYDKYLRGTACVRSKSRVYLSWDDIIVEGYLVQANASEAATEQNLVQFQFQMFLTNYQNISNIGDPNVLASGQDMALDAKAMNAYLDKFVEPISSTRRVREANIQAATIQIGKFGLQNFLAQASLFSDTFSDLQGILINAIGSVKDLLQGNVRVPAGFEGQIVFDDVQLALESVPLESITIGPNGERTVSMSVSIGAGVVTFKGTTGSRFTTDTKYGPLSLNNDEFIGRRNDPTGVGEPLLNLFSEQLADEKKMVARIRKIYHDHGLITDDLIPALASYMNVIRFATAASFGLVSEGAKSSILGSMTESEAELAGFMPRLEARLAGREEDGS